jgi:hypothetical protein
MRDVRCAIAACFLIERGATYTAYISNHNWNLCCNTCCGKSCLVIPLIDSPYSGALGFIHTQEVIGCRVGVYVKILNSNHVYLPPRPSVSSSSQPFVATLFKRRDTSDTLEWRHWWVTKPEPYVRGGVSRWVKLVWNDGGEALKDPNGYLG